MIMDLGSFTARPISKVFFGKPTSPLIARVCLMWHERGIQGQELILSSQQKRFAKFPVLSSKITI